MSIDKVIRAWEKITHVYVNGKIPYTSGRASGRAGMGLGLGLYSTYTRAHVPIRI
jgi:hypothetical protein